jgi:hypothetical protein
MRTKVVIVMEGTLLFSNPVHMNESLYDNPPNGSANTKRFSKGRGGMVTVLYYPGPADVDSLHCSHVRWCIVLSLPKDLVKGEARLARQLHELYRKTAIAHCPYLILPSSCVNGRIFESCA